MSTKPKYEDVVAQLEAALGREAALREELDLLKPTFESTFDAAQRDRAERDALQQRLTVAEQRETELIGLLKLSLLAVDDVAENCEDQADWATANSMHALSKRITAALKPAAEQTKICPNCKVCMGSPDFPENCLINGVKP